MKKNIKIFGKIQAWKVLENNTIKQIHVNDYKNFKKNKTPFQALIDTASMWRGITVDAEIKYIALSSAYDPPNNNTVPILEIGRVEPLEPITQINNKLIIEAKFDSDTYTRETTLASVIDKKTFTVSDTTGFNIGDRIKISNSVDQRKIVDIDSESNLIYLNEDLTSLPTVGLKLQQMISRLHLVYGSDATLSLNTGSLLSVATLTDTKSSTEDLYTRHEIEFLGS